MKMKSLSERLKEQIKKEAYSTREVIAASGQIRDKIDEMLDSGSAFFTLRGQIEDLQEVLSLYDCSSEEIDKLEELITKLEDVLVDRENIVDSIKGLQTKWDSSRPFGK